MLVRYRQGENTFAKLRPVWRSIQQFARAASGYKYLTEMSKAVLDQLLYVCESKISNNKFQNFLNRFLGIIFGCYMDMVTKHDIQHTVLVSSKPETSTGTNRKVKMKMDRTHREEKQRIDS